MGNKLTEDRITLSEIAQSLAEALLASGMPSEVRWLERDLENAGIKVSLPEKNPEELASVLEATLGYYPELIDLGRAREVSRDNLGEWTLEHLTSNLSTTSHD